MSIISVAEKSLPKSGQKFERYNNWQLFHLNGLGEFQIPNTMELQSKYYRDQSKELVEKSGIKSKDADSLYIRSLEGKRIVFQQKGLNAASSEFDKYGPTSLSQGAKLAFQRYARISINIEDTINVPAIGDKLCFSEKDLTDYTEILINGFKNASNNPLIPKSLSYDRAVIKNINNNDGIYIKYQTKLKTNPPSNNELYVFYNKDKIYSFTIMYRSSPSDIWTSKENDIRNVIKTIKFE